jgi:hypothetical protein
VSSYLGRVLSRRQKKHYFERGSFPVSLQQCHGEISFRSDRRLSHASVSNNAYKHLSLAIVRIQKITKSFVARTSDHRQR